MEAPTDVADSNAYSAHPNAEAQAVAPFFVKALVRDTWSCLGTPTPADTPVNAGMWKSKTATQCAAKSSGRSYLWPTSTWQRATGYVEIPAIPTSGQLQGQNIDAMAFGIESNIGAPSNLSLDVDNFDYCVCGTGGVKGVKKCVPACETSCE